MFLQKLQYNAYGKNKMNSNYQNLKNTYIPAGPQRAENESFLLRSVTES